MGTLAFYDKALPGAGPDRLTHALVIAADDDQIYAQLFGMPSGKTELSLMLTPISAREVANALLAAAGYVERTPREGSLQHGGSGT